MDFLWPSEIASMNILWSSEIPSMDFLCSSEIPSMDFLWCSENWRFLIDGFSMIREKVVMNYRCPIDKRLMKFLWSIDAIHRETNPGAHSGSFEGAKTYEVNCSLNRLLKIIKTSLMPKAWRKTWWTKIFEDHWFIQSNYAFWFSVPHFSKYSFLISSGIFSTIQWFFWRFSWLN